MEGRLERLARSGQSHVAYGAARALGLPGLEGLKRRMYADARLEAIVAELGGWPGPALSSHKSARQHFHKLSFLADLGYGLDHPGLAAVVARILASRDGEGLPLLPMAISEAHGGSGKELGAWALCDAPTILYSLLRLGHRDPDLDRAVLFLEEGRGTEGWGCRVSPALGSWRGPGKKGDPCPYATLVMTKLLIAHDPLRHAASIRHGADCLLGLWEASRERHPYMFYMGSDFRKLKLPFIWYDLLHVLEVLSRVESALSTRPFAEMVTLLRSKAGPEGSYVPESAYLEWKAYDFGQKKEASAWMSLRIEAILARAEGKAVL